MMNGINFYLSQFTPINKQFFILPLNKKIVTLALAALSLFVYAIVLYKKHLAFERFKSENNIILIKGEIKDGNGNGEIHLISCVKRGQFKNYKLNGKGRIVKSLRAYEEGEFMDDKLNGEGKAFDDNKNLYEGKFKDGILYEGIITLSGGVIYKILNGEFKDGQFNGNGSMTTECNEYKGEFKNNKLNGLGKISYTNGTILDGEFVNNDLIKGRKSSFQTTEEGEFLYGKLHGKGKRFSPRSIEEGEFKNGKLTSGLLLSFGCVWNGEFDFNGTLKKGLFTDTEGTKMEGSFENGELVSGSITLKDGQKWEGQFKDGKLNGEGKYSVNGAEIQKGIFIDGMLKV